MATAAEVARLCSLVGVNLEGANLEHRNLRGVNLSCANLRRANCAYADFTGATIVRADFSLSNLHGAVFTDANVSASDFTGSYMKAVLFLRTKAWSTLMRRITAKNALFINSDFSRSDWAHAELLGARFDGTTTEGARNLDTCQYTWWRNPFGGYYSMTPRPGWHRMDRSALGGLSFQENSARQNWHKGDAE